MARILVIDNEQLARFAIRKMLLSAGHQVVEAENGVVATDLCKVEAFDLVITDILMPEKEGIATIHELKREFPNAKIIAVSGGGFTGKDYLPMAKDLGADYTFPKPFRIEELIQALNELLAK